MPIARRFREALQLRATTDVSCADDGSWKGSGSYPHDFIQIAQKRGVRSRYYHRATHVGIWGKLRRAEERTKLRGE